MVRIGFVNSDPGLLGNDAGNLQQTTSLLVESKHQKPAVVQNLGLASLA